ncbi:DUF3561 family protein [Siccibacter colletis]|uniref:DUF3561 family protein n=1 Tax=Siccibacter colletis TaxID=1505757 RepID=UPI0004E2577E|nr:DUF3561 family protein [Siccibacter colletis]
MRDSTHMIYSQAESPDKRDIEETTWSVPGAILGLLSWLLALGIPFLIYGSNTLFFLLYTWPFFLALLPVSVVVGVALHSLLNGRLLLSIVATIITVAILFGALFLWLMG